MNSLGRTSLGVVIGVMFALGMGALFALNRVMIGSLEEYAKTNESLEGPRRPAPSSPEKPSKQAQPVKPAGPVEVYQSGQSQSQDSTTALTRMTYLSPNRDYVEHTFYSGGVAVGYLKLSMDGKILEKSGQLPHGQVAFTDRTKETHGTESFRNGQLDGWTRIYDKEDRLRNEKLYAYGQLLKHKEYYMDGKIRLDVDYKDGRERGGNNREDGEGKLYYRDGQLRFEWKFTMKDPQGYKKFYSPTGFFFSEEYYSAKNVMERKIVYHPQSNRPKTETTYENGKPIEIREYDTAGILIDVQTVQ